MVAPVQSATGYAASSPSLFQTEADGKLRLVPQTTDTLVADIEESADGKRLITHDRRFAPRLWDAKSLRLLRVLGGAQDPVPVVRFSPDGLFLLTLGQEELRVWDAIRAKPLQRMAAGPGEFFVEAKFSPDAKLIALSTSKGRVQILNRESLRPEWETTGLPSFVPTLDWSGGGRAVAAGSGSTAIVVQWPAKTVRRFESPSVQSIRSVDLQESGELLAVTDTKGTVSVFRVANGAKLYQAEHVIGERVEELRTEVGARFVLQDDSHLLTFGATGDLVLRDALSGTERRRLRGHTAAIDEIRLNPTRTRAGTHGDDERVLLWDLTTGQTTPFALKPNDLPTAAAFSSNSDAWYLGLIGGEIRKYDLKTGAESSGTLGSTHSVARVRFLTPQRILAITKASTGTISVEGLVESKSLVLKQVPADAPLFHLARELFSESGRYNISDTGGNIFSPPIEFDAFDLWTGKGLFRSNGKDGRVAEFIPATETAVFTFASGSVFAYDFRDQRQTFSVEFPNAQERFTGAVAPDGQRAVHGPYDALGHVVVWNTETKEILATLEGAAAIQLRHLRFSPDGKTVGGIGDTHFALWDAQTGKAIHTAPHGLKNVPTDLAFSRDSKRLMAATAIDWAVLEAKSGGKAWTGATTPIPKYDLDQMANRSGTRMLSWNRNNVRVWDVDADKEVTRLRLNDLVIGAVFSPDDQRVLTFDLSDGIVIWNAKTWERLGSAVQMRSGDWLVMDGAGRYDATDPDAVDGAMYVLEWDGGLEPLDVAQFKSQFWDPGLLAKLLGQSAEPLRPVPDLSSLKLFPRIELQRLPSGAVAVGMEPRGGGGIGQVTVSVNGKEIAKRRGVGFFNVNLAEIQPHLLPETRLKPGESNVLSVRASNAEGTLTSLPVELDLGIPEGLRAPEVRLFGLFVGVGDYVGNARDLKAPPSDANRLRFAIESVSSGLLRDRVELTTMVTAPGAAIAPTRANILKWFDDVSKKATSSDILLVFFAGHGMDKIGPLSGYYFLTAEANPDVLSAATIGTMSISGEDLRARLQQIAANKQVVILDTCHSGAAAGAVLEATDRSVSGDFQRAWEAIKDATGTWMLAGSAADQQSYESANVEHGVLTYALLEAIDRASPEGLRAGQGDDLFVDVERWLSYAANRVESLKNEVGLTGIQRPEFKRSKSSGTFDLGVLRSGQRGLLGLKPPKPIVLLGAFEQEQEDPAGLEVPVREAFRQSTVIKAWLDVNRHPNVYRLAGEYTLEGDVIRLKVFLQRFDGTQQRRTLETFELSGSKSKIEELASRVLSEAESRITKLEGQR